MTQAAQTGEREAFATSARLRMLSLGDSYTIGESVSSDDRWPVDLAGMLRSNGIDMDDPVIIARTGWTTRDLSAAIDDARPRGPFDLVTLLIGVNDQYRGRSAEDYRPQFRLALSRAMTHAGKRPASVIVISIPDWGVTPHAQGRDRQRIATDIDAFNAVNRQEATAAGTHYVDITGLSRLAGADRGLVAGDGLHPSAAMYLQWARAILPVATGILSHAR
jgi:lysophospholipase L1-like esterase